MSDAIDISPICALCGRAAKFVSEMGLFYCHCHGIDGLDKRVGVGAVSTHAMLAMSYALSFGTWYGAMLDQARAVGHPVCRPELDTTTQKFSTPQVQQLRADLIRTKLAAIEAKRARPLGWDPEGQA